MSYKSRSNWNIPLCLKDCKNKGIKCESCIRYSNFTVRGGNYFGGLIYDRIGYSANVIISSVFTLGCLFLIPHLKIKETV